MIRLPAETETIARCNPGFRHKIIPRNRTTIGRRLKHDQSDSRRNETIPPSQTKTQCNARRHPPIIILHRRRLRRHRTMTTGLSLPEDENNNHRERRSTIRVIPALRWPYLLPTRVNPAHPSPAATTRRRPRPWNARNAMSHTPIPPRHRRRIPTIKVVPAMGRHTDPLFAGCVKRRGAQVAPGVFAFATSPPLAKSARGHHAAAI